MLDGVVILGGPRKIARPEDVEIAGREIVVIQTKANRLGMYLLGQVLFSRHLMERLGPKSVRTVAVCDHAHFPVPTTFVQVCSASAARLPI